MSATLTTGNTKPISIADITRAMQEIDLLPKNTEWFLASPDGKFWRGTPEQMIAVLAPHHHLLKPLSLGEILKS